MKPYYSGKSKDKSLITPPLLQVVQLPSLFLTATALQSYVKDADETHDSGSHNGLNLVDVETASPILNQHEGHSPCIQVEDASSKVVVEKAEVSDHEAESALDHDDDKA